MNIISILRTTMLYACSMAVPLSYSWANIVADGSTQTTITTTPNAPIHVDIAPIRTDIEGDISHNRFSQFDVLSQGVQLDNQDVRARTIVNEVTSNNPSLLQGTLEVLGNQAHVIIANPNGITVDGGRFINTGGVALTTGEVSFVERNITPITIQQNTVVTTNQGIIEIKGAGLSGVFTNLELIAKQVAVNAAITNEQTLSNSRIRLVGGDSVTEYDSSISVVDLVNPWAVLSSPETVAADNTILVDISHLGSMNASKIEVVVTDKGAGIRHAGNIVSTLNDVILTAEGRIELAEDSTIESAEHVFLLARNDNEVHIEGANVRAGRTTADGIIETLGGLTIEAGSTSIYNGTHTPSNIFTTSGSAITTTGKTHIRYSDIFTGGNLTIDAGIFTMDSLDSTQRASIITGGALTINGRQASQFNGALLESNGAALLTSSDGAVTITGGSFVMNDSYQLGGKGLRVNSWQGEEINWDIANASIEGNIDGAIHISGGNIISNQHSLLTGHTIQFDISTAGNPSNLIAENGGVLLTSTVGAIDNHGGLLQGNQRIEGNSNSLGAVTLRSASTINNQSLSSEHIAIVFGVNDDLALVTSGGTITNNAGRLISNAAIHIDAQDGQFYNITPKATIDNPGVVETYNEKRGKSFFRTKKANGQRVAYGDIIVEGLTAAVTAGTAVTITARGGGRNIGGDMYANGGEFTFNGTDFINEASISGSAYYERVCAWICYQKGNSTITVSGGNIFALNDIHLNTEDRVENIGGSIISTEGNIHTRAPNGILIQSIENIELLKVDRGIFHTDITRFLRYDQGGAFVANMGRISLDSLAPVILDGGTITAEETDAPSGIEVIRTPISRPDIRINTGNIGALGRF